MTRQLAWLVTGFCLGLLSMYMTRPMVMDNRFMRRLALLGQPSSSILQFGHPGPVNDMLHRDAYIASYSRRDRLPYWVGEHLTAQSLKSGPDVSRDKSKFHEDDSLPALFRARLKDYASSGYDRGHMAPAGDAKSTQETLDETFLLSNMAPQVGPGFNRQYWAYLEGFCRDLTRTFDDVYVYTGPLFLPQPISTSGKVKFKMQYNLLGADANVAVPTHFFKVILTVEQTGNHSMGAFVLPNRAIDSKKQLVDFQVNLSAIEKASGLLFFQKVDRSKFENLCTRIKCTLS